MKQEETNSGIPAHFWQPSRRTISTLLFGILVLGVIAFLAGYMPMQRRESTLRAEAEAQGLEIDTLNHEDGTAQMEINLRHGDPLELADQVFLFKRTIREAALKHQMYATFMAKPIANQPGSAMHIHQSVLDVKTGGNIFSDAQGKPSPEFFGWALDQAGVHPEQAAHVGNRLDTDVRPAKALGLATAWVLRGEAPDHPTPEQLAEPDIAVRTLDGLGERLMGLRA